MMSSQKRSTKSTLPLVTISTVDSHPTWLTSISATTSCFRVTGCRPIFTLSTPTVVLTVSSIPDVLLTC